MLQTILGMVICIIKIQDCSELIDIIVHQTEKIE